MLGPASSAQTAIDLSIVDRMALRARAVVSWAGLAAARDVLGLAACALAVVCIGFVAFVSPALASFPGANGRILLEGERDSLSSELPNGSGALEIQPYEFHGSEYSPNGSEIAVPAPGGTLPGTGTEEKEGENGPGVYVMTASGGSPTRLSPNYLEGGFPLDVSWSPNASQIVYSRIACKREFGKISCPAPAEGGDEIFVMSAAGGSAGTKIAKGDGPVWSPNGNKILFWLEGDLETVNPEGSDQTVIATKVNEGADWSPNGRKIAYSTGVKRYGL